MLLHHRRVIDHNDYRHANWFQASEFEAKAKLNVICQKKYAHGANPFEKPPWEERGAAKDQRTPTLRRSPRRTRDKTVAILL